MDQEESTIELGRASTDADSIVTNTTNSTEGFEQIPTVTVPNPIIRRHVFPTFFPILTLLRYVSVGYASDFVTTEFETQSIRHSAVSIFVKCIIFNRKYNVIKLT